MAVTVGALLIVLIATGCGSAKTPSSPANAPLGKLTHVGGLTYRTISVQEATLLVKTQVGGRVTCGAVETDSNGRENYHCAVTQGTNKLACLVPHIYFPKFARDPNAPKTPAVLCSPGGGYQRPVTPNAKKNV